MRSGGESRRWWGALGLVVACGGRDPILDRADELAGVDEAPAAAGGGPVQAPAPAPGAPEAPPLGAGGVPAPGQAGEPTPVQPPEPAPGIPDQAPPGGQAFGGDLGPAVTVRGVVRMEGWSGTPIRIDVFDGDQLAAAGGKSTPPRVIAMQQLSQPGPYEVAVPSGVGKVWVGAYADENGNGRPDRADPSAWAEANPVYVDKDQSGVDVVLVRGAAPPQLE